MLNRHPLVAIPLESLFILDYLRVADRIRLDEVADMLIREPEIGEWGLDVDRASLDGCQSFVDAIRVLHVRYAQAHGKHRWGQKTPRFVRELPVIKRHFPSARFIHVIRDPRAVASSLAESDVHFSNPLYATRRWLNDVGRGLAFEAANESAILRVVYEQLVLRPAEVLADVCRFLDLPVPDGVWWQAEGQASSEYSRFYEQIHGRLDEPVTAVHVDKWKSQLSPSALSLVEHMARPLMLELGYEPVSDLKAPTAVYVRWLRIERQWGRLRQLWKYLTQRRQYLFYTVYRKWRLGLFRQFLGGTDA